MNPAAHRLSATEFGSLSPANHRFFGRCRPVVLPNPPLVRRFGPLGASAGLDSGLPETHQPLQVVAGRHHHWPGRKSASSLSDRTTCTPFARSTGCTAASAPGCASSVSVGYGGRPPCGPTGRGVTRSTSSAKAAKSTYAPILARGSPSRSIFLRWFSSANRSVLMAVRFFMGGSQTRSQDKVMLTITGVW